MASVADSQRVWVIESETEGRPKRPTEGGLGESVHVGPIGHTIEGDIPSLIVREHPHPAGGLARGEDSPRGGEGLVLPSIEFHGPEPILRWLYDSPTSFLCFPHKLPAPSKSCHPLAPPSTVSLKRRTRGPAHKAQKKSSQVFFGRSCHDFLCLTLRWSSDS